MPVVRTTMEPWKELVVDDRTYYSLKNQNLLVEEDTKDEVVDPSMNAAVDADQAHAENQAQAREALGEEKPRGRRDTAKAKDES